MASSVFELTPGALSGPGWAVSPLTRRRALVAGAAAALAVGGCALARRAVVAPPVTLADSDLFTAVPGLQQAFARSHPSIHFVPYPLTLQSAAKPELPSGATYWLSNVGVNQLVVPNPAPGHARLVPLDAPLHALNFNPEILLPGTLGLFALRGVQLGLPVQQDVLAVRWRRDVFAALGLQPPAPDWTLADLQTLCARLGALIAAGKAPQVTSVLAPPMATTRLKDLALWVAFALGFGGSVVSQGRFALDAAAMNGVAALVDLFRRFAPAAPAGPAKAASPAPALALDTWQAPSQRQVGAEWAYARLPRLPVRAVIPTGPSGVGVVQPAGSPSVPRALTAAVTALAWLYSDTAQPLLAAAGNVPVLAAPEAQGAFWDRQAPGDRAVGDWRNFLPYNAGWPGLPNNRDMANAIAGAIHDPTQLPDLVAAAVQAMNADVAGAGGAARYEAAGEAPRWSRASA